jgi:hypothetical protein
MSSRRVGAPLPAILACLALLAAAPLASASPTDAGTGRVGPGIRFAGTAVSTNDSAVGNFSQAVQRLVALIGVSGGGLLAIVWARVALSWFSNDVTKKVQAKERARDALVGTLLFTAALTGLVWGLAHWVLTGS